MSTSPPASSDPSDSALRYYLSLPYRIVLTRDGADDEPPWRAQVEDLPGCAASGATLAEAAERISSALADWVARALAEGREVPEPRSDRSGGKLLLRMPLALHTDLARAAEREQVSLNTYINGQLARAVDWHRAPLPVAVQEPVASQPSRTRRPSRTRLYTWTLAINLVVIAFTAVVAVLLLLEALSGG